MTLLNFTVRFEFLEMNVAKAFVNEIYVARVKHFDEEITVRNGSDPFPKRAKIPAWYNNDSLEACLIHRDVVHKVYPLVIRAYLLHYSEIPYSSDKLSAATKAINAQYLNS